MFVDVLFIGTSIAQSQSLTINDGIFYMIWMWGIAIKVLIIICTLIYLFIIYFQFICHCHILFEFTTRLAFHKEQNMSKTPGAVNNIGIIGVKIYEKQQILLYLNC